MASKPKPAPRSTRSWGFDIAPNFANLLRGTHKDVHETVRSTVKDVGTTARTGVKTVGSTVQGVAKTAGSTVSGIGTSLIKTLAIPVAIVGGIAVVVYLAGSSKE